MGSYDDRQEEAQLSGLLREWTAPEPPPWLEQKVMQACSVRRASWWRLLFTGYIRVPVALVYVLGALMTFIVWKVAAHTPAPCVAEVGGAVAQAVSSPTSSRCGHAVPGYC